jgi:hypothetical protein
MLDAASPAAGAGAGAGGRMEAEAAARLAERVRGWLRMRRGSDVSVAELEAALGFAWQAGGGNQAPPGHGRDGGDPLLAMRLYTELEQGLADLLRALDARLALLPGLTSLAAVEVEAETSRTINLMWNRLRHLYASHDATDDAFVYETARLKHAIALECVTPARARLRTQLANVRALTSLCAAEEEGRDVAAELDEKLPQLRELCAEPPSHLLSGLRHRGVVLGELAALLAATPLAGGAGVACLAPSHAVRVVGVEHWMRSNAALTQQACTVTVCALHRLADAPLDAWECWDGVRLAREAPAATEFGRVLPCAPLQHSGALDGLLLVAERCGEVEEPTALRSVRLAAAVHALAASGRLRPRRVRAEVLLALCTRALAEAHVAGAPTVSVRSEEEEEEEEEGERGEAGEGEDEDEDEEVGEVDTSGPASLGTGPTVEAVLARIPAERVAAGKAPAGVDLAVRSDYALLSALRGALDAARAAHPDAHETALFVVEMKVLCAVAAQLDPSLRGCTRHALPRTLSQALRTRVLRVFAATQARELGCDSARCSQTTAVRYASFAPVRRGGPGGTGLVMSHLALCALRAFVAATMRRMRHEGKAFAQPTLVRDGSDADLAWFGSRQAVSNAKQRARGRSKGAR